MTVLVTGAAGFIGAATSRVLLDRGDDVFGIDNLNDYYDPSLKQARLRNLQEHFGNRFRFDKVDFADALGKKPIVLLFATPQFCQSRVCGPVVDVAEQVRRDYGADAEFIHMEIYNDNHPGQGVRPQVRAFHLPDEPWLFVIDRHGVIRTAIEGPFDTTELSSAVKAATGR